MKIPSNLIKVETNLTSTQIQNACSYLSSLPIIDYVKGNYLIAEDSEDLGDYLWRSLGPTLTDTQGQERELYDDEGAFDYISHSVDPNDPSKITLKVHGSLFIEEDEIGTPIDNGNEMTYSEPIEVKGHFVEGTDELNSFIEDNFDYYYQMDRLIFVVEGVY